MSLLHILRQVCGKFTKGGCNYAVSRGGCRNSHWCIGCRRWSTPFSPSCETLGCPGGTVQQLHAKREQLERRQREELLNAELESFAQDLGGGNGF